MIDIVNIRSLSIFKGMNDTQYKQVRALMENKIFSAGETIFTQNSEAVNLYILIKGKVAIIYKPYDGPPLNITSILPGQVFGWSAVLGRKNYTSGTLALEESVALCISRSNLRKICKLFDDTGIIFLEEITANVAERLNQTNDNFVSVLSLSIEPNSEG